MTGTMIGVTNANEQQALERAQEVRQFEDSNLGVKGLLDSGLSTLPPMFIHPPDLLSSLKPVVELKTDSIPIIDLSGSNSDRRPSVIEEVARAAREFGFFQIVNHGVPTEVLGQTIAAVKAFHEQPAEVKARIYRRESETGVAFFASSVDLLHSNMACWRDSLRISLGPVLPDEEEIPEVCRNEVMEWNQQTQHLGVLLMGLLSEGLGLSPSKLEDMTCVEKRNMLGHYYPYCPQPDLTVGLKPHTDKGVITVLLQDQVGGLQVKHGEAWLDVTPSPGVLIVNIGDLLQIISNDEYKSVEHRVLANPGPEPRLSVAVFYYPLECENQIGPIPELVSPEKPAAFRQFKLGEYLKRFQTEVLDGKTLKNHFET